MRYFLFLVRGIPGLEEWTDRKLLNEVFIEQETERELVVRMTVENNDFSKLIPSKNYAMQVEKEETNEKSIWYFRLNAYEVFWPPTDGQYTIKLLHERIQVEA